jgi:hypothetical protein
MQMRLNYHVLNFSEDPVITIYAEPYNSLTRL